MKRFEREHQNTGWGNYVVLRCELVWWGQGIDQERVRGLYCSSSHEEQRGREVKKAILGLRLLNLRPFDRLRPSLVCLPRLEAEKGHLGVTEPRK